MLRLEQLAHEIRNVLHGQGIASAGLATDACWLSNHPTFSHRNIVVAKAIGTSIKAAPVGCPVVLVEQAVEFPDGM
jgi:hypothetical protein